MTRTNRLHEYHDRHESRNLTTKTLKKAGHNGWGNFEDEYMFEIEAEKDCTVELEQAAEPIDPLLQAVQNHADSIAKAEALRQSLEFENTIVFTQGFAPRRRASTQSSVGSNDSERTAALAARHNIMKSDTVDLQEIARTSTALSSSLEATKVPRLANF